MKRVNGYCMTEIKSEAILINWGSALMHMQYAYVENMLCCYLIYMPCRMCAWIRSACTIHFNALSMSSKEITTATEKNSPSNPVHALDVAIWIAQWIYERVPLIRITFSANTIHWYGIAFRHKHLNQKCIIVFLVMIYFFVFENQ